MSPAAERERHNAPRGPKSAAGLTGREKILLGGSAVKKGFGTQIGADATALDAIEDLEMCRMWTQK